MAVIKVKNQAELDAALAKQSYDIELVASGVYTIRDGERYIFVGGNLEVTLETRESSNGTLVTRESSNGRLETRESSNGTLVTRESSNGTLETWGSSNGRLETWGSSNGTGKAGKYAATIIAGVHDKSKVDIPDCIVLPNPDISTPEAWCEYYGALVVDGAARLYKALGEGFKSGYGFVYEPGTMPVAPDWDGPARECGGGFHFCASPSACHQFVTEPKHYVECWVLLADLVVHKNPQYPTKTKGRAICKPIVEVDIDGEPVKAKAKP